MATLIRGTIPANEFALQHVLTELQDVTFEIERVVQSGEELVMPLVWVHDVEREAIEAAFDEDPTVEDADLLVEFEEELLYRLTWVDHVKLLVYMLTNAEATVLEAYGRGDTWQLRILYPERSSFAATEEFCSGHGLTLRVESIRELDDAPAGRYGLTIPQYEALETAFERGYFSVPRETTLDELADELGGSHQALSEMIRRAIEALIEDTLIVGKSLRDEDEQ